MSRQPTDPSRLGTGRDAKSVEAALEQRYLHFRSQSRLCDPDRDPMVEMVPLSLKPAVGTNQHLHIQIPRHASQGSGRPPASQAETSSLRNPGRYFDLQSLTLGMDTRALALSTDLGDFPTSPPASETGGGSHHRPEEAGTRGAQHP